MKTHELKLCESISFDLEKALNAYTPFDDIEKKHVESVLHLLKTEKEPFLRETKIGHITGSVFLLSSDFKRMLMTHHKKLNKWLQFGGHSDGDKNTLRVAMRELSEESGVKNFQLYGNGIADIDVHTIKEPAHSHYDIRFIFTTDDDNFVVSDESNDLKWFTLDEFTKLVQSDNHYNPHNIEALTRFIKKWRARRESNSQSAASKADAISVRPRAHVLLYHRVNTLGKMENSNAMFYLN